MKALLKTTAVAFGLLPGIVIIQSGLGVPPGRGVLFGGGVEAVGIIALLVLKINSAAIKTWSRSTITRLTIALTASAFAALLVYMVVYGRCVISQEPRGTVYFPLWTTGERSELVSAAGGRAAAIEAYGRYAVYQAVKRNGDVPTLIRDVILLVNYAGLFTLLTLASGMPATYAAPSR